MRHVLRVLLLTVGCVAMMATQPPLEPITDATYSLRPGALVLLGLTYFADEAVESQVSIRVSPLTANAGNGRLVGIISSEPPAGEALDALDLTRPFTVGEKVQGVGTVHFILEAPSEVRFGGPDGQPALLPAPSERYLTLLAQEHEVEMHLHFAQEDMKRACDCDVRVTIDQHTFRDAPAPGDGGRDGGTLDGGADGG